MASSVSPSSSSRCALVRKGAICARRFLFLLAIGIALPVSAVEPEGVAADTSPETRLQEIEVSGDRIDDSDPVPGSKTTLDRKQILRRGAQNVGEALRGESGIAVASDSAQGQNPVLRGLQKERLVMLVDGLRLNAEQPFGAISSMMSLGFAERIEAVKGPASVLYGSGALGGAVNVELRQARFKPGVSGEATVSYDSASKGLRGVGMVNLSAEDHALMLGISSAKIGDYRSPRSEVDRTGYDSEAYIGQYRFRIDSSQQLRFSAQKQVDTDVWYPGTTDYHPFAAGLLPFYNSPIPPPLNPMYGKNLKLEDLTMVFHSPLQERRMKEIGYSIASGGERPINVDLRIYRQDMERTVNAWLDWMGYDFVKSQVVFATKGAEAKAEWLIHPQHLLTVGVSTWRMDANPQREMTGPPQFSPTSFFPFAPFVDGFVESAGYYVLDDMRFDKLNIVAGLRRDTVKGGASMMAKGLSTTYESSGLTREDSSLSSNFGVLYEVTPLLRPYFNISRAFRAASLIERFVFGPRGDGFWYYGDPQVKPEIARQVEFGVKGRNESVEYSAAIYRNRISDYITGLLLPSDVNPANPALTGNEVCGGPFKTMCKKTINLGEAVIDGVEANVRWQYRSDRWVTLNYTRMRGVNRDMDEPLYRMPADELSLGWEGPISSIGAGWIADATLRLVRRQDRVATEFSRGTEDPTAGFATLDFGATWNYAKMQSVRFLLKNLADKTYHEHLAVGIPGRELDAPGRSLQMIWRGQF